MISKSTFVKALVILVVSLKIFSPSIHAQSYCIPNFINGCFSWYNQSIVLDSINWTGDYYSCDLYDYTYLSTTLTPGTLYSMQVSNGNWCGCGVWIDLNQDFALDTSENFFHSYSGNQTNTYNIPITIPDTINAGTYRMRVIAGWGSDCYNPGTNGYGPCGNYQYGNFDDFTIHVSGLPNGINNVAESDLSIIEVSPNPGTTHVKVSIKSFQSQEATLQLTDVTGKIIQSPSVINPIEVIDLSDLSEGIYFLRYHDEAREQTIKLVK